jgi:hypothetical protein
MIEEYVFSSVCSNINIQNGLLDDLVMFCDILAKLGVHVLQVIWSKKKSVTDRSFRQGYQVKH